MFKERTGLLLGRSGFHQGCSKSKVGTRKIKRSILKISRSKFKINCSAFKILQKYLKEFAGVPEIISRGTHEKRGANLLAAPLNEIIPR